jgi:hypothetical protein
MTIVPANLHWWWFPILLVCLSPLTALGASYINLFEFLKKAMAPCGVNEINQKVMGKKVV